MSRRHIRVLLYDPFPVVLYGLRTILVSARGIRVVGQAHQWRDARRLIRQLKPDVLILEPTAPDVDSGHLLRSLCGKVRDLRVLVLSAHKSAEDLRLAIEAGVAGYLTKDSTLDALPSIVRSVTGGETYLARDLGKLLADSHTRLKRTDRESARKPLTSRETLVLQLLSQGKSAKESAAALGIGYRTVDSHRMSIMKKLDIHSIAGLVRHAIEHGLLVVA